MLLVLSLSFSCVSADSPVFAYSVEKPIDQIYDKLYQSLEDARLYVVLEPDIGKNLSGFAERWGDQYNRNELTAIRSMVFCNGWYANQVSNKDPQMLALCPLSLTLIEKGGKTTALFARPSVIAADSPAKEVVEELENAVIAAIKEGMN
jgi:uncharacterized protein (DUF302 family)